MRPIRLALPLCLLLGARHVPGTEEKSSALAAAQGQLVPIPAPSPEFVAAMRAARDTEALLAAGRFDEAAANFRGAVAGAPPGAAAAAAGNLHAFVLAYSLIRAGRRDAADRALAWYLGRPRQSEADALGLLRLIDLRLYIQAGRGDILAVLALLDARLALRGSPHAGCPAVRYFPEVVAPAHHDPRVAAKLRALGCWQSIIDQLDDIAARPIGATMFDPGLPPRPRPPPR